MAVTIQTPADLARAIRAERRAQGLRQEDLAVVAGVGLRFVSELERGKPSAQIDLTLRVAQALGIRLTADAPHGDR